MLGVHVLASALFEPRNFSLVYFFTEHRYVAGQCLYLGMWKTSARIRTAPTAALAGWFFLMQLLATSVFRACMV